MVRALYHASAPILLVHLSCRKNKGTLWMTVHWWTVPLALFCTTQRTPQNLPTYIPCKSILFLWLCLTWTVTYIHGQKTWNSNISTAFFVHVCIYSYEAKEANHFKKNWFSLFYHSAMVSKVNKTLLSWLYLTWNTTTPSCISRSRRQIMTESVETITLFIMVSFLRNLLIWEVCL